MFGKSKGGVAVSETDEGMVPDDGDSTGKGKHDDEDLFTKWKKTFFDGVDFSHVTVLGSPPPPPPLPVGASTVAAAASASSSSAAAAAQNDDDDDDEAALDTGDAWDGDALDESKFEEVLKSVFNKKDD